MRIAIVEDEIRIREGIHKLLSKADPDYEIVGEAENGREGVTLLLHKRPDLVLLDIRMPEMNGIDMLEEIHAHGFRPQVIILSAYSDFSYAQQAMKLGAREYLLKPIVVDELLSAVRRAQEMLRQQDLIRSGSRSRRDVLSSALYSDKPLSPDIFEYAKHIHQLGEDTPFALMLIQTFGNPDYAIEEELSAFTKQYIGGECTVLSAQIQGCTPCVFTGFDDSIGQTLEKKLFSLWRTDRRFVAQIGMCCGLPSLRPTALKIAAQMEYGLIVPNGTLLDMDHVQQDGAEMLSYPIETENAVRMALARHDVDAAGARIRDFGTFFGNTGVYSPREIKEAHVRFVLAVLNTAHELGWKEKGILSRQELLDRIMSAIHPSQLATVCSMLEAFVAQENKEQCETGILVRRARSLMRDFFAQGITLEEIAQKLSVTPEYLGTQIHRETGMTFGTLMKQLRVEEAKKLLLTTDKKLYEIAASVGYADAKYFSKVFQSITGMLPAEYRRMNK